MRKFLKDREHLIRMAAFFVAGLACFLIARALLIPKDFHELGHFRTGALADNMARPMAFAGRDTCESCHLDVVDERKESRHATIACEACHGALATHADDPGSLKPARPDARTLCLVCHREDVASPRTFKQVSPQKHMGGKACISCHKPHHPEMA
jgi:nitrate/TMAO reductase-like tetraheme cytochrome c subunit